MADDLYPYQVEGAQWLTTRRFALLADEMGLGKTAQVIRATDLLGLQRILVLGPAVARFTWAREFEAWSPRGLPKLVVTSGRGLPPTPAPITICSYDLAPRLASWLRRGGPWDVVVLDEAHFLKTPEAQRTRAVFGPQGVVRASHRTWALSGTPSPNHAAELWVLLRCFGAYEGGYWSFVRSFCRTVDDGFGVRIVGTEPARIPDLRKLLAPLMLRRRKADVLTQLPSITYGMIDVEPGPVDMELCFPDYYVFGNRESELRAKIAGERAAFATALGAVPGFDAQMRLLESMHASTAFWRRYVGLQKVQPVVDLVTMELDCRAYDKVVIFAWHRDVIENLRVKLQPFKAVTLYGGTAPETREKHIKKFQQDPKCRVFIGNTRAAGTNINLTVANQVLIVEPDWVPGNNAQAVMRCHRIGQTKQVSVRVVTLVGEELDARVAAVLRRKTRELTALYAV